MAKPRGLPFQPGNQQSKGRPPGSLNKATQACRELLAEYAEPLTRKVIGLGIQGDATAMRLSMERICPGVKDAPINFAMPDIKTLSDLPPAANAVMQAVTVGKITTTDGERLMKMIETFRSLLESSDLKVRVQGIEATLSLDDEKQ